MKQTRMGIPQKLRSNLTEAARHYDDTTEDEYRSATTALLWHFVETYIEDHREDFEDKGSREYVYVGSGGGGDSE